MIRELWQELSRYIHEVARARVLERVGYQSQIDDERRAKLAASLAAANTAADLASRSRLWGMFDQAAGKSVTRSPVVLPAVPDERVVSAWVSREPRLAHSAEAIHEIYRLGGMSAIKAIDSSTLHHVRARLATAQREGIDTETIAQEIARDASWPRAYARVVVRTNLAQAASDGTQALMRDPEMRAAMPALQYVTAGDRRVRPAIGTDGPENHRALDGLVAPVDWPGWDGWSPPGGYQCRCRLVPRSLGWLRARGMIGADGQVPWPEVPAEARFHRGFGHRRVMPR